MATDNLMAGVTGALTGASDILGKYYDSELKGRRRSRDLLEEQDIWEQRLPMEEASKIRVEKARPRTTFVQQADGAFIPVEGKVSRQPVAKTPTLAPEDKAKEAYLIEQGKLKAQAEAGKGPVPKPTVAQSSVDRNFGAEYTRYVAAGGSADIEMQIKSLEGVVKQLESGENDNISGPIVSAQPDWTRKRIAPESMDAQQTVEQSIQRTLKQTLGGQFTEKEGVAFMERGYDKALPEKMNATKLQRAINSLKTMAAAKEAAVQYYEEHGTLVGFKGKLPSLSDIQDIADDGGSSAVKEFDLKVGGSFGGGKIKAVRWKQ